MIAAFNTVYSALQGFFSRSFWFAAFLPVALFGVLHAAVAAVAFDPGPGREPVKLFGIALSLDVGGAAPTVTGAVYIILMLVVIAYALMPLMPLLRGLLDGSLLPTAMHDWLREARQDDATETLTDINALRDEVGQLQRMYDDMYLPAGEVRAAYAKAEDLDGVPDAGIVERAEQALQNLRRAIDANSPTSALASTAQTAVLEALAVNNPSPKALATKRGAPVPDAEKALARRTNAVADRLEEVLDAAYEGAVYRLQFFKSRCRFADALEQPRATAIGDARFVVERYTWDVYRVDFDFLWPRLLVAMKDGKADDPMLTAIENARSQVDFAVLSLALAVTVPAVWLPVLLFRGSSPWLFLAIGAATPLVLGFFYKLVFEGQLALGEIVKTAVDRSRFLVLKMLHQAEPLSRSDERALWLRIARAEADGRLVNLLYAPSKQPQG